MQMGNSPIAESMTDIRNILNRIDGVNAPVQEQPTNEGPTQNQAKAMMQLEGLRDMIMELEIDDDAKTSALTALEQVADDISMQESAVQEDNGKKTVWYTITPGSEKEKGMMQAEIDQGGKITNILAATPEDLANQLMKLGVTHDDYDFGHTSDVDFPEEDEGWNNKEYGNDAHGFIQDTHEILKAKSESYQPFPEADEFNIEEDEDFEEVLGPLGFPEDETELFDAEYRGRKVPLNKPMRGDVKKFKVYVKDPKTGNVKKVNFGHGGTSAKRKTMRIRKSNPKARKSFRARHNCANPGPKTKARYWSCRKW